MSENISPTKVIQQQASFMPAASSTRLTTTGFVSRWGARLRVVVFPGVEHPESMSAWTARRLLWGGRTFSYLSGRCSAQLEPRPRLCHTCQRFHGTHFERTELMKLKVKDLRDYLHLHEVSTQMCREKEELVELVLGQQTQSPSDPMVNPLTQTQTATQHETTPPPDPTTTPSTHPDSTSTDHVPSQPPPTQEDSQTLSVLGPEEPLDTEGDTEPQSSDTEEVLVPGRRASLSDLATAEDIEALSVRQLKEILARNFVNYKGCCEKWELMERVTRLYHDQKLLQNLVSSTNDGTDPSGTPGQEENLCKICMNSPIDCVLLECGHMVTCTKCGKQMKECPICRQYVISTALMVLETLSTGSPCWRDEQGR
ncbi:hypothetical protein J4Q44_G00333150 [Coregonus suidteri]|uniref:RING-type domain-containing protein n=1 Tax=Coregonus suidteri TaxID=861788 RepID=A0AAN8KQF9_9TELE